MLFISIIVLSFLVFCFYDFFQTSLNHTCLKLFFSSLFLGGFVGLLTVNTDGAFFLVMCASVGLAFGEIGFKHYNSQE